jgi:hypothetical protein
MNIERNATMMIADRQHWNRKKQQPKSAPQQQNTCMCLFRPQSVEDQAKLIAHLNMELLNDYSTE